jgi:hypothetical protein
MRNLNTAEISIYADYAHTHMHTHTHAYMHTCIRTHMHTCTHSHIHTCTHTEHGGKTGGPVDLVLSCVDNFAARMSINAACNELSGMYVCMHVCMYACMYVCMYV